MAAGLVKGEGFAVDASVMEANASRYHGKAPDEIIGLSQNVRRAPSGSISRSVLQSSATWLAQP